MIFFQKKVRKNLQVPKNVITFASQLRNKPFTSRLNNGIWCNGNTADSGPAFPGSSPGSPTKPKESLFIVSKLSFLFIYTSASLYRQCRWWPRPSPEPTQATRQDANLLPPLRWGQATGSYLSVMLHISMPLRRLQDRRGRDRRTRCNC